MLLVNGVTCGNKFEQPLSTKIELKTMAPFLKLNILAPQIYGPALCFLNCYPLSSPHFPVPQKHTPVRSSHSSVKPPVTLHPSR